jgi:hypothetical protein
VANTSDEAAALFFGLTAGYLTAEDVVGWADQIILSSRVVPDEVTKISLSGGRAFEMEAALRALAGSFRPKPQVAHVLCSMKEILAVRPERAQRIASGLVHLFAGEKELPQQLVAEALHIDYSFELAEDGIQGTIETARAELAEYLRHWSAILTNAASS